jgi:hypothetical protein
MLVYQIAGRLEAKKGSLFALHSFVVLSLQINAVFFVLVAALVYNPFSTALLHVLDTQCLAGMWPVCFACMALEASLSGEATRRLLCFPCQIPSLLYPLVLVLLFSLLMGGGGALLSNFVGLGMGYLWIYFPELQLSAAKQRLYETQARFDRITSSENFVAIDNVGNAPAVWSPFSNRGGGGGAAAPSSAVGAAAAPVASERKAADLTGAGHRLDGGSSSSSSSSSSSVDHVSRGGGGAARATASRPAQQHATLAARMEKMAAAHKKQLQREKAAMDAAAASASSSQP